MKKALGSLAVALAFAAVWPLRDMKTIVLLVALLAGLSLAWTGLSALLRPLARALRDGLA